MEKQNKCRTCGEDTPTRRHRIYCSRKCFLKYRKDSGWENTKRIYHINCSICNKEMIVNKRRKYCIECAISVNVEKNNRKFVKCSVCNQNTKADSGVCSRCQPRKRTPLVFNEEINVNELVEYMNNIKKNGIKPIDFYKICNYYCMITKSVKEYDNYTIEEQIALMIDRLNVFLIKKCN